MPKKNEKTKMPGGFHITWPGGNTVCGWIKFVKFCYGQGVLNLYSLGDRRPDWITEKDGKLVQVAGPPMILEHYAAYFRDKGCTVKPLSWEASEKLRKDLAANPDNYKPEPPKAEKPAEEKEGSEDKAGKEGPAEPTPPHEQ